MLAGDERMLIDGELQITSSGATFDVIHPASEQVAGQATDGTVEDMARAVGAARRAFDETDWSRDLEFRYHCLTQLHDALERNKERLRRVLITEVGCPVTVTGSQIESPIAEVKHWAEHGRAFEYLVDTGVHETPLGPARRKIHYEPVGVVGAITPWNVPFYLNIAETVPALMAGNTVVLKPAQLTPVVGQRVRPDRRRGDRHPGRGVQRRGVQRQRGGRRAVGRPAGGHDHVHRLDRDRPGDPGRRRADGEEDAAGAGWQVGAHRARRRGLQFGAADGGDDGVRDVRARAASCPAESCCRAAAMRKDSSILKTSMENFPVGDPWTPGNMQGPQISETQRQKVLGLIKSGIDSGARLVTGGGIPENLPTGYYVQPTLLADVDPDSQVAQEEIFGPVLTVTPYDTDDEAVAIANNTIYGLSGEVSSADVDRAFEVAKRMRTGNVTINGKSHFGITSPFGGTKQSGLGYRNGEEGYKEYLEAKTIGMPDTAAR